MKIKLSFGEYDCTLTKHQYENGRVALCLNETDTGEPFCVASVNIPEFNLRSNQVLIKNWSENEGVLESLVEARVIEDTGEQVNAGFVYANLCYLLPEEWWAR